MAIQIIHRPVSGGDSTDVTRVCGEITVSGNVKGASREATIEILRPGVDDVTEIMAVKCGDFFSILDDGNEVFYGNVWDSFLSDDHTSHELVCFDRMKYFLKTETNYGNFVEKTAGEITDALCSEVGVSMGEVPGSDHVLTINTRGMTAYEALMTAWTEVKNQTGIPYYPVIVDRKLNIIEKGHPIEGEPFRYGREPRPRHLTNVTVHETSEDAVTAVIVRDEKDAEVDRFFDTGLMEIYGYIQKIRENKAQKDQPEINAGKIEVTAEAIGDWEAVTGYSVYLQSDLFTSMLYIESDSHKVVNGVHTMSMTLILDNEMDEMSGGDAEGKEKVEYTEKVTGTPEQRTVVGICECDICKGTYEISDELPDGTKIYLPQYKDMPGGGNFTIGEDIVLLKDGTLALLFDEHQRAVLEGKKTLTAYMDGERVLTKIEPQTSYQFDGVIGDGVAHGTYVWPIPTWSGNLTTYGGHTNNARDFPAPYGSPIVASDGGVVDWVQYWDGYSRWGNQSYGNVVRVQHGGGRYTLYAHMSSVTVKPGQTVSRGQQLGAVGSTGNSTGPHLHMEVVHSGWGIDPATIGWV